MSRQQRRERSTRVHPPASSPASAPAAASPRPRHCAAATTLLKKAQAHTPVPLTASLAAAGSLRSPSRGSSPRHSAVPRPRSPLGSSARRQPFICFAAVPAVARARGWAPAAARQTPAQAATRRAPAQARRLTSCSSTPRPAAALAAMRPRSQLWAAPQRRPRRARRSTAMRCVCAHRLKTCGRRRRCCAANCCAPALAPCAPRLA